MSDDRKPEELPSTDEGTGLPTPPSPGRMPPPHLPPPPDKGGPSSEGEGADKGE